MAATNVNQGDGGNGANDPIATVDRLLKTQVEVEFFKILREELKKTSDFFVTGEEMFLIRHQRVLSAFLMLKANPLGHDKNTWSRLLTACVKFYRDVLMMENFAIMNYCACSKILKKHDKSTGFDTREAFMRNIMSQQNFTHYTKIAELLRESERLFTEIQQMDNCMPLQDEERLFIEAIRELNRQASKVQANEDSGKEIGGDSGGDVRRDSTSSNRNAATDASAPGNGGDGGDEIDPVFDEMALHTTALAAVDAAQRASNSASNSMKSLES